MRRDAVLSSDHYCGEAVNPTRVSNEDPGTENSELFLILRSSFLRCLYMSPSHLLRPNALVFVEHLQREPRPPDCVGSLRQRNGVHPAELLASNIRVQAADKWCHLPPA